jgi:hypothetical protein
MTVLTIAAMAASSPLSGVVLKNAKIQARYALPVMACCLLMPLKEYRRRNAVGLIRFKNYLI